MQTLLVTRQDIATLTAQVGVDHLMDTVIRDLREACATYSTDSFETPVRTGFSYDDLHTGLIEWMPVLRKTDQVALKVVGYHPQNPAQHRLPTVLSTVLCFDTANGHVTNIIDGTFVTSLRTGAASAIASGILAPPESRTLGLVGAGAQAVTQLHALSRQFDLSSVLVYDTDGTAIASFSERVAPLGLSCEIAAASIDTIARRADIICTATSIDVGRGPVLPDARFRDSVHFNAVGSDFPGKTELPLALLRRSLVCPDFREQAVKEGECQHLEPHQIGPDLVDLVQRSEEFEGHRSRSTVFDSTGWALEDFVAVNAVLELVRQQGLGQKVDLESTADDPRDPYGFLALDDAATVTRIARGAKRA